MRRLIVLVMLAGCVSACGQSTVVTPNQIAENYVFAIAEGNFAGACGMIEPHARAAMMASTKTRISCAALLARCLPISQSQVADQSQLLYGDVLIVTSGNRAQATLSRTPVANATKQVSMLDTRKGWMLTTPGRAVSRCIERLRRQHRHRRRAHG